MARGHLVAVMHGTRIPRSCIADFVLLYSAHGHHGGEGSVGVKIPQECRVGTGLLDRYLHHVRNPHQVSGPLL